MNGTSITRLYDLLTSKLGKETAENLTNFIDNKISQELENKTKHLVTKADLSENKAEIMRWMFIYWVSQLAATFGFILLFLRK